MIVSLVHYYLDVGMGVHKPVDISKQRANVAVLPDYLLTFSITNFVISSLDSFQIVCPAYEIVSI